MEKRHPEIKKLRENEAAIFENESMKILRSKSYNYIFNKVNGCFARYGKTMSHDPQWSPFGPEILDIEVTTSCNGIARGKNKAESPCQFCYKSNTKNGTNMSFKTFKTILDLMPKTLCQIAFGVDAKAESNPDLWKMMEYSRSKGVIPNITVAQVTNKNIDNLIKYCGAVSVSRYDNKDICYDSVKMLTDRGFKQVNIHQMVSAQTYEQTMDTFRDILTDPRLANLNAIVLLSLKKVGRGVAFNSLNKSLFASLINYALDKKIPIGMDSCFCSSFLQIVRNHPNFERFAQVAEPCEVTSFSSYISVDGKFSACSFTPRNSFALDATKEPFIRLWNHPGVKLFRKKLQATRKNNELGCRECPVFQI